MTLELTQVAPQVKAMGQNLARHQTQRSDALAQAAAILQAVSADFTTLTDLIAQAEKVQQQQRFSWVGAAPTREPLAEPLPLPPGPERLTVIAAMAPKSTRTRTPSPSTISSIPGPLCTSTAPAKSRAPSTTARSFFTPRKICSMSRGG